MIPVEVEHAIATWDVSNVELPAAYKDAQAALEKCERVDEAAEWADKAAAISCYAKQANDATLQQMAMRIRVRAVRRIGELLKQIPAKAGGGAHPQQHRSERAQAAKDAGLSRDQAKDALRVAKIPKPDFEKAVESEDPPTVTELTERRAKLPKSPAERLRPRKKISIGVRDLFRKPGRVTAIADLATRHMKAADREKLALRILQTTNFFSNANKILEMLGQNLGRRAQIGLLSLFASGLNDVEKTYDGGECGRTIVERDGHLVEAEKAVTETTAAECGAGEREIIVNGHNSSVEKAASVT